MTTVTKETFWAQIVEDPTLYETITTDDNLFNYRSDAVWQVMNETFIANGTDFEVSKWEELLGLSSTETTLNVRKAAILNHITENLPITVGILEQLVKEITNDDYLLDYDEKENKLFLIVPEETKNDIEEVVLRVIPLVSDVTYMPAGYLVAEFLESTGTQYILSGITSTSETGAECESMLTKSQYNLNPLGARNMYLGCRLFTPCVYQADVWGIGYNDFLRVTHTTDGFVGRKYKASTNFKNNGLAELDGATLLELPDVDFEGTSKIALFGCATEEDSVGNKFIGAIFNAKLTQSSQMVRDFIPVVDAQGVPCMFDKVTKQTFYNSGTGQFILGMMLEQARKLGKLPTSGGKLTVSLPSNYAEDEGVVSALAKTQKRGWVITIQTYEVEAAASTFALKRVWVRKRADEQGSYVDSEGSRWQVEWCVDIVGADPEQEGYEQFQSVDIAVEYWKLTPYVDPTLEEQFNITNEE